MSTINHFVLIDGELRSLCRSIVQGIIMKFFDTPEDPMTDILLTTSIRVVASIIGIFIWRNLTGEKKQENTQVIQVVSLFFILVFFYFANSKYFKNIKKSQEKNKKKIN